MIYYACAILKELITFILKKVVNIGNLLNLIYDEEAKKINWDFYL